MGKVKKKKKELSLHQLRIITLRRASIRWKFKYEALNKAKVWVDDGHFKNGKNRKRVMFRCACCKKLFSRREVSVDHISPVVVPSEGFIDWNNFVPNLLCEASNLQVLCKTPCHKEKTAKENTKRLDKKHK